MVEKKSAGIRWDSPVILYGGLAAIAIVFGRQILSYVAGLAKSFHKDSSITPTNEEILPARSGVLSAVFTEPANNGQLKSSVIPFLHVKLKVAVNNPEAITIATDLVVGVTWYPRVFGEKTTSQAALQLKIPPGRSVYEVSVARPMLGGSMLSVIDAVATVSVAGRQTSSVAFTVD